MKNNVLLAIALLGITACGARADVGFSVSFGTYHYTPAPRYCPPTVVYTAPPAVVYTPPPVVYQPVYAPVYAPACPTTVVVEKHVVTKPHYRHGYGHFNRHHDGYYRHGHHGTTIHRGAWTYSNL